MLAGTFRSLLSPACCSSSSSLLQAAAGLAVTSAALAASSQAAGQRTYHVARLASRGVISLAGEECVQFLQGMTTNDVRPLEQPGAGPVYTMLLTAKGKYLHDLFAYRAPGDSPELLLDVDAAGLQSALQWLGKYKLRRKLQLTDASRQYSVWAAFDGQLQAGGAGQWRQDPRLPQLGLRGIFDAQQLPPPPAAAGSSSRKQQAAGMSIVSEDHFQRWRYMLGIAEGDTDVPTGEVAPLECNLDALAGISYSKGCYIGQERNSYTHFRGIIRKRLMPVALPGLDASTRLPCPLPIVSSAAAAAAAGSTPSSSRSSQIGTLTNHCGDMGMAYMKLAPALAAAAAAGKGDKGPQLQVQLEGGAVQQVVPQRPEWWPAEWGIEEAGPPAGSSSS
uniref:CAF17 C-terminal domain-containing protein n=1 Tax=Tetradesmus obliquus TaxID=3088 RepID=A0A383VHD9_TETOB|eukprot:jgi/Sobl393_1/18465/SZX64229.1